ncbi:MAG: molybdenum cofactor biosynthesis protein MoaE [Terracidiphilus sp.]|nr:molybdenum cofactor biosynthesis protein MoaE [Terracidiphilus sp.]MDR3775613.1 molybdenum cofactor biosynthesis protein MoaE [Terracidiphilus sp.]
MMQIQVLPFGVLKDWLGASSFTVDLTESANVADLLAQLGSRPSAPSLRGIAVSVNAEYASGLKVLHAGDEVGLLPPVSGGSGSPESSEDEDADAVTALTRNPIDAQPLLAAAKHGDDGAVVVFDGIVRNNSRGLQTLYLDYEAYEEMAAKQMRALAREARSKFGVRHVTLVHRLGRLQIGETSVLIIVSSAHRAQAFEACRWLIDTLKKTVPIWKQETFVDGAVWAAGEPFPAGLSVAPPEDSHGS